MADPQPFTAEEAAELRRREVLALEAQAQALTAIAAAVNVARLGGPLDRMAEALEKVADVAQLVDGLGRIVGRMALEDTPDKRARDMSLETAKTQIRELLERL